MDLILDPILSSEKRTAWAVFAALVVAFPALYWILIAAFFMPLPAILYSVRFHPDLAMAAIPEVLIYGWIYHKMSRRIAARICSIPSLDKRRTVLSVALLVLLAPMAAPIYYCLGYGTTEWASYKRTFTIWHPRSR
jgi:hypothetical protein